MNFYSGLDANKRILFWIALLILAYYFYQNFVVATNLNNELDSLSTYETEWINTDYGYGYDNEGSQCNNPADTLINLVKELGEPTSFDRSSGGRAVWDRSTLHGTPFERIEIRDEEIPHDKPNKHVDFLYSWYKMEVPEHKIKGLKHISEGIDYDKGNKTVIVRCHNLKTNLVTHWIVKKYADDELTIDEAVGMYGPMIKELEDRDLGDIKYLELEHELI